MSVASVAVLMSCLIIIGAAVLIFFNIDSLLENIESQNVIMAFCDIGADEATVKKVGTDIEALDNIESCEFVSKAQALEQVRASLGDNAALLKDSDDSFLPDGYKVTVKDMELFTMTVMQLQNIDNIYSVQQNTDLASRLERVRKSVSYVSIAIIALLFAVAIFIIANTVKITMFSRKLEISIMKAVGATNWFIRWPFLIEGVFIGLISAILAFGLLYLLYFLLSDSLLSIFGLLGNGVVNFWDYGFWILAGFILVSVVTGGFGSIISIGRYLKEQGGSVIDEA